MKSKKSKSPAFVVAILVALVVALYAVSGVFFAGAEGTGADVVYEMTNKNIGWTYAGKDGAGR